MRLPGRVAKQRLQRTFKLAIFGFAIGENRDPRIIHAFAWIIFIIVATFVQLTIRNQNHQVARDSRGLVATDRQRQDNPYPLLD
jgi:hypothetical protein